MWLLIHWCRGSCEHAIWISSLRNDSHSPLIKRISHADDKIPFGKIQLSSNKLFFKMIKMVLLFQKNQVYHKMIKTLQSVNLNWLYSYCSFAVKKKLFVRKLNLALETELDIFPQDIIIHYKKKHFLEWNIIHREFEPNYLEFICKFEIYDKHFSSRTIKMWRRKVACHRINDVDNFSKNCSLRCTISAYC